MKLLEVYRKGNSSLLTAEQKEEVFKRPVLYKKVKMKGVSSPEVRKRIKQMDISDQIVPVISVC